METLIGIIVHSHSSTVDTHTPHVQALILLAGVQPQSMQTQRSTTHGNIAMRMTTTQDHLDGTQDPDQAVQQALEVDIAMEVDQALEVDQAMEVDQDQDHPSSQSRCTT